MERGRFRQQQERARARTPARAHPKLRSASSSRCPASQQRARWKGTAATLVNTEHGCGSRRSRAAASPQGGAQSTPYLPPFSP